jgi:P4 family phage/plasmid primase-like protien
MIQEESNDTSLSIFKINTGKEEDINKKELNAAKKIFHSVHDENGERTIHLFRESFHHYEESKYVIIERERFKREIVKFLRKNKLDQSITKKADREEVLTQLESMIDLDSKISPPIFLKENQSGINEKMNRVINTTNGILYLDEFENFKLKRMSNTPNLFTYTAIPIKYNPIAKHPTTFHQYLNTVQPDKDVQTFLQQWLGYNLIMSTEFEKFVIFIGEGANGKSVFCTIMRALLGEDNVSSLSLEQFDETRSFHMASTDGKLSNIAEELSESMNARTEVLKKFISGNHINVERKYQSPFSLKPTARLTFATNELPTFKESSNGLWRRMVVIPWTTIIPEIKQDRRLGNIQFWKDSGELPGIFNWALEGLINALQTNQLRIPSISHELTTSYKNEANPVSQFLKDNFKETNDPNSFISTSEVLNLYELYSIQQRLRPVTVNNLVREIKKAFPNAIKLENAKSINGVRQRVWQGLERLPDKDSTPAQQHGPFKLVSTL